MHCRPPKRAFLSRCAVEPKPGIHSEPTHLSYFASPRLGTRDGDFKRKWAQNGEKRHFRRLCPNHEDLRKMRIPVFRRIATTELLARLSKIEKLSLAEFPRIHRLCSRVAFPPPQGFGSSIFLGFPAFFKAAYILQASQFRRLWRLRSHPRNPPVPRLNLYDHNPLG